MDPRSKTYLASNEQQKSTKTLLFILFGVLKIRHNGSLSLNFNSFPLPLPLIRWLFSKLMAHYHYNGNEWLV